MMMSDLKATLAEYSRDTRDKMNMAANGRKKQTTSTMKDWISGVIWEESEDDDDGDDDDDDNEEDHSGRMLKEYQGQDDDGNDDDNNDEGDDE